MWGRALQPLAGLWRSLIARILSTSSRSKQGQTTHDLQARLHSFTFNLEVRYSFGQSKTTNLVGLWCLLPKSPARLVNTRNGCFGMDRVNVHEPNFLPAWFIIWRPPKFGGTTYIIVTNTQKLANDSVCCMENDPGKFREIPQAVWWGK